MDEKDILFKVLTIIGYEDNKLEFINKFFSFIYIEAIAEIGTKLDTETQKKLVEELKKVTDEASQKEIVLKYFSKAEFDANLTEATKKQFAEYLTVVIPTLPEEKKEELISFVSSLQNPKK